MLISYDEIIVYKLPIGNFERNDLSFIKKLYSLEINKFGFYEKYFKYIRSKLGYNFQHFM